MVFGSNPQISLPITDHTNRTNFTTTEKSAYLDAALCLTTAEPTIGLGDSATLWQEMQYAHIGQVTWIHNVVRRAPVPSHDDLQILFFVYGVTNNSQGPIPSLVSLFRHCPRQLLA